MSRQLSVLVKELVGEEDLTVERAVQTCTSISLFKRFFSLKDRLKVIQESDYGRAYLLLLLAQYDQKLPAKVQDNFQNNLSQELRKTSDVVRQCISDLEDVSSRHRTPGGD